MKNKRYMKLRVVSCVLLMISLSGLAQQIPQYTQYMYNTVNINPAYAGTREAISIFGLHRTQWVGLDGAPKDNAFSINSPIGQSKVGVGLSFENHRVGPTSQNDIAADVSYTIPTSENFKLSFGIKASANLFNLDASKLNPENPNDAKLYNYNDFTPNIGAGLYWYSDKAYVGLSVPRFIENDRNNSDEVAVYTEKMHYYLIGGYVFDLSNSVKFKPAALMKMVQGAPLQADVSANFLFNEKFVLGAAYRWSAAVSAMAGFQISNNMFIGYAYDHDTTDLGNYNSGSHEIFLRYEIFPGIAKIITPRFF